MCKAGTIPDYLYGSDVTEVAEKIATLSHDELNNLSIENDKVNDQRLKTLTRNNQTSAAHRVTRKFRIE